MNEGRKECRNEWINQWLAHLAPPPVENVSNSRQLRRDSDENRQDKCQTPTVFSPTAHGDVRRGSRLQIAARAKGLTRLKHKAAKRKQIRWHLLLNSQTQTNFDFKIHSAVPFHCFIHPSIHPSIYLSIYLCPSFWRCLCEIELSPQSCALTFCRQLSHIKARTRGNRDPTSATPWATVP